MYIIYLILFHCMWCSLSLYTYSSSADWSVTIIYTHRVIIIIILLLHTRIDSHFLIKIADFGLSEDIYRRNYFRQGTTGEVVKLPVKWMAPESLSDGHFSEKSDVVCIGMCDVKLRLIVTHAFKIIRYILHRNGLWQ